jgi:putative salt-induced outer membrane protein YdiY
MTMMHTGFRIGMVATTLLASAATLHAQAPPKELGWSFTGRLTTVFTSGNSESSTFGVGSTLKHVGRSSEFKFESGAVRTESGITTRRAIGTPANHRVDEETVRKKTAEALFARARNDLSLGSTFVVFAGADWLRNTFAGIDSRFLIAAGAGNVWADNEQFRFKTDYGITYTFQQDVVENPFVKQKFPGLRVSYDLMRQLTTSTKFESALITDLNIDNTDDVRADFSNALSISINSVFAFKPALQLLWRNDPALTAIDLFANDGTPTGQTVLTPLQKLDSFLNLALVVTLK